MQLKKKKKGHDHGSPEKVCNLKRCEDPARAGACAERARAQDCREAATGRNKLERKGDRNHSDRVETWQRVKKRIAGRESDKLEWSWLWMRLHLPVERGGKGRRESAMTSHTSRTTRLSS